MWFYYWGALTYFHRSEPFHPNGRSKPGHMKSKLQRKQQSEAGFCLFWSWAKARDVALPEVGLLPADWHKGWDKGAALCHRCLWKGVHPPQEWKHNRCRRKQRVCLQSIESWKGANIRKDIGMVFRVNEGDPIALKLSITKMYLNVRSIRLGNNRRK